MKALPHWVAHRGDMTRYPENTLLALGNALALGCHIEFDLQMNADHEFVVIHDDNFFRTADVNMSVLESTRKDLQLISVHQPRRYHQRYFPQIVPRLEDVLELLSSYPDAKAFIEIKVESLLYWGIGTTMQLLLKRLTEYSLPAHQCVLISFNLDAIAYAKKHSDLALGWVLKKYHNTYLQQALLLQPDYLICNHRKIPLTGTLWSSSWQWMLYDVVSMKKALAYTRRGIHFIETGDIGSCHCDSDPAPDFINSKAE